MEGMPALRVYLCQQPFVRRRLCRIPPPPAVSMGPMGLMGHICPVMCCTTGSFASFDLRQVYLSYLSCQSYSLGRYAQAARVRVSVTQPRPCRTSRTCRASRTRAAIMPKSSACRTPSPISSFISHHSSFVLPPPAHPRPTTDNRQPTTYLCRCTACTSPSAASATTVNDPP